MAKNSRVYCVSIDEKGETFLYSSREFNVETIDISVLKKQGLPIPYPRDESGVSNSIGSDRSKGQSSFDRWKKKYPLIRLDRSIIVEVLSRVDLKKLKLLINDILIGPLKSDRQSVFEGDKDTRNWADNLVVVFEDETQTLEELMDKIENSNHNLHNRILESHYNHSRKYEHGQ